MRFVVLSTPEHNALVNDQPMPNTIRLDEKNTVLNGFVSVDETLRLKALAFLSDDVRNFSMHLDCCSHN